MAYAEVVEDRLDSDDVARILDRAHAIEAAHELGDQPALDSGGVSPNALVDAAREVGIDQRAVRDAIALERFETPSPASRLDRLAGASVVVIDHVVHRSVDDVIDDVEAWLTSAHHMRAIRLPDGSLQFRPRSGAVASVSRSVSHATGEVTIRGVECITVTAVALSVGAAPDRPRTALQVVADRSTSRTRRIGAGTLAGVSGVGAAVAGVVGAVALWPIVTIPLVGGGYAVIRSGAGSAERTELELLRVVAAVDRDERPTGLLGRATNRARRAITKRS